MDDLRQAVFQAIGQASMCWDPLPEGEFESTRAAGIGEELCTLIARKVAEDIATRAQQAAQPAAETGGSTGRQEINVTSANTQIAYQPSVHASRNRPAFGFARQ